MGEGGMMGGGGTSGRVGAIVGGKGDGGGLHAHVGGKRATNFDELLRFPQFAVQDDSE